MAHCPPLTEGNPRMPKDLELIPGQIGWKLSLRNIHVLSSLLFISGQMTKIQYLGALVRKTRWKRGKSLLFKKHRLSAAKIQGRNPHTVNNPL